MTNHLFKRFMVIALAAITLTGCSWYESNHSEVYTDIISIARKSPRTDFSQYKTYAITDAVLYFKGEEDGERVSNEITDQLINTVIKNMDVLGYKKVTTPEEKPDMIVDLTYLVSTYTSISYTPGFWWDWDYWWGWGGWDPFYPYYPYPIYPVASSYSAGSLVIEILDTKQVGQEKVKELPVIWHGLARSIMLEGHTMAERTAAIDKCFSILPPTK